MNQPRIAALGGLLLLLGGWYAWSFTEWIKTEPIQIVAQFRPLPKELLARRANNPKKRPAEAVRGEETRPGQPPNRGDESDNTKPETARRDGGNPARRGPSGSEVMDGGGNLRDVQPFVFSLDGKYALTSVKVVETSSTNSPRPVTWWVRSAVGSPPTATLLYGRVPGGLIPVVPNAKPDKLRPGRTYTLYLEAGRRRGEKAFSVPQEAEPMPPDDGDYHPEKDLR